MNLDLVLDWLLEVEDSGAALTALETASGSTTNATNAVENVVECVKNSTQSVVEVRSLLAEVVTTVKMWTLSLPATEQRKLLRNLVYKQLVDALGKSFQQESDTWNSKGPVTPPFDLKTFSTFVLSAIFDFHSVDEKEMASFLVEQCQAPQELAREAQQRGVKRIRATYRSTLGQSAQLAPFGSARLFSLIREAAFFVRPEAAAVIGGESSDQNTDDDANDENQSAPSRAANTNSQAPAALSPFADELCDLVAQHNFHSARITDAIVSVASEIAQSWLGEPAGSVHVARLQRLDGSCLREGLASVGLTIPVLQLPLCLSLSAVAPRAPKVSDTQVSLSAVFFQYTLTVLVKLGILELTQFLAILAGGDAYSPDGEFITTNPFLEECANFTAQARKHASASRNDTFALLTKQAGLSGGLSISGPPKRGGWANKQTSSAASKPVVGATKIFKDPPIELQFPEPAPLWSKTMLDGSNWFLFWKPARIISGLIQVGCWVEAATLLENLMSRGIDLFLLPAEDRLVLDTKQLEETSYLCQLPRSANPLWVLQVTTLATFSSIESGVLPLSTIHALFPLLEIAGSYLAQPAFLSRLLATCHAIMTNAAANVAADRKLNGKEILNLVAEVLIRPLLIKVIFPCLRVLPPSPFLLTACDQIIRLIPDYNLRRSCFDSVSSAKAHRLTAVGSGPGVPPHEEIANTEHRAIVSYCVTRVTPRDAHSFIPAITPVLMKDPMLICEKFLQQAIGYDDSTGKTILMLAELMSEAPPLTIRAMCYLILSRIEELANEDKPTSPARVASACNLLSVIWRLQAEADVVDSECIFYAIERALGIESKATILCGLSLLRSIFYHFLHDTPDSAEHWSREQLKAICCGKYVRWYAAGAAESLLNKLDESHNPLSIDRNADLLMKLLAVRSAAPVAADGTTALKRDLLQLPAGVRILLLLAKLSHRLFPAFKDLPGMVENTLTYIFDQYDLVNDMISTVCWLTLTNKALTVDEKLLIFNQFSESLDPGLATKLGSRLLQDTTPCLQFAESSLNLTATGSANFFKPADGSRSPAPEVNDHGLQNGHGKASSHSATMLNLYFSSSLYFKFWFCKAREVWVTDDSAVEVARTNISRTQAAVDKLFSQNPKLHASIRKRITSHLGSLSKELVAHKGSRAAWITSSTAELHDMLAIVKRSGTTSAEGDQYQVLLNADAFAHYCLLSRARLSHEDALSSVGFLRTLVTECCNGAVTGAAEGDAKSESDARKLREAVGRWACDVIRAFITEVMTFLGSFSNGEVKRLSIAMLHLLELFHSLHRSTGYEGFYRFWDKPLPQVTVLVVDAYIAQSLSQVLMNFDVPHLIQRSAFTMLEKLTGAFPLTRTSLELMVRCIGLHNVKGGQFSAPASSLTKRFSEILNGTGSAKDQFGEITASETDEEYIQPLLRDEQILVERTETARRLLTEQQVHTEEADAEVEEGVPVEAEGEQDGRPGATETPLPEEAEQPTELSAEAQLAAMEAEQQAAEEGDVDDDRREDSPPPSNREGSSEEEGEERGNSSARSGSSASGSAERSPSQDSRHSSAAGDDDQVQDREGSGKVESKPDNRKRTLREFEDDEPEVEDGEVPARKQKLEDDDDQN